ncbi:hypothetical protein [Microtetraspora malaysiensis]|uniref:hypothetical protein n=1 Tax=Microtetraspora malaysiensis TaxID=161358 RepID=UPI003D90C86D
MSKIYGLVCDRVETEVGTKDDGTKVVRLAFVNEDGPKYRSAHVCLMPLDQVPDLIAELKDIIVREWVR